MNNFELKVIEYTKGLLKEFEISDILTNTQELFNNFDGFSLIYNEDIESLFEWCGVEITNYYLKNFEYNYNCTNIIDMTLTVIKDIILNYVGE